MIYKTIKLLLLFIFISISYLVNAQQENLKHLDYNNLITNPDIFFDKKSFNPSYAGDTLKLKANLKKMNYWLGFDDSKDLTGVSIEKYFKNNNSGIGISYCFDKDYFKSHIFKLDYNYRFNFNNKLILRIATTLGLYRYTLNGQIYTYDPDPLLGTINDWSNHPLLSVGILLKSKKHELGLSYSDILNFNLKSTGSNIPVIFKDHLIINYNYSFNLSKTTILIPELIQCWSPEFNYWIFNTSVSFINRIYAGVLYRSNEQLGFMLGGKPWKKLKMDYVYSYGIHELINSRISYGFHGLSFSFILQ